MLRELSTPFAHRSRSLDFTGMGLYLPNPDPILKAQGKDIRVYRELRSDAHLGGCVRRRKSAVKALEWGFNRGTAGARTANSLEAIFADIDVEQLINDTLEAALYGYQPIEIIWGKVGSFVVPTELRALPPEWFCFGPEGELRFKSRDNPMPGEAVPSRKFLLPRQDASYANPYGVGDLSMCFWPQVFKKGGLKFWLQFTEKFGMPYLIGKSPPGASDPMNSALLESLEAMVQDAVAVIPDGAAIEALESGSKSASADLYKSLVMFCRSEVSIALTGTNQTVEATSTHASATAGLEVAHEIRDGDAKLATGAVNQLARWICELNFADRALPTWSMWDQESQDKLRAERDQQNFKSGARFTREYWTREYGYKPEDLANSEAAEGEEAGTPPKAGAGAGAGKAAQAAMPAARSAHVHGAVSGGLPGDVPDYAQLQTSRLEADAAPGVRHLVGSIHAMLGQAESLDEFRVMLDHALPKLDGGPLRNALSTALQASDLAGMADAGSGDGGTDGNDAGAGA